MSPDSSTSHRSLALVSDPALRDLLARLVASFQPDRVYLFGSKARGDAGPDSDYDLLVWTRSAFDARLHLRASLPATVVAEGKLLYAA